MQSLNSNISPFAKTAVTTSMLVGCILGQVVFGLIGDWLGRKKTFHIACVFILLGGISSACVIWSVGHFTIIHQLAACHFLLGIGFGGGYPLAATIVAESSHRATRRSAVATVFSMQGFGMLLPCLVILGLMKSHVGFDTIWRVAFALLAVPPALVLVIGYIPDDSESFQRSLRRNVSFSGHASRTLAAIWPFRLQMCGTTMACFLVGVTCYGNCAFMSHILGHRYLFHSGSNFAKGPVFPTEDQIWNEASFAMSVSCIAIPGFLLAVLLVDHVSIFYMQVWGFLAVAGSFFSLAWLQHTSQGTQGKMLLVVYGLTMMLSNMGPSVTTFVMPVEVFPTFVRATCQGLSAAAGTASGLYSIFHSIAQGDVCCSTDRG